MNKIFKLNKIAVFLLMSFVFISVSVAEEISFQVEVDRNKIQLGEAIQLTLRVSGTKEVEPFKLANIEGFELTYMSGPNPQFTWVNGKSSSSVSYKYSLFPLKTGKFQIPQLTLNIKGNDYSSEPVMIEVVNAASSGSNGNSGSSNTNVSNNIEDKMILVLKSTLEQVFIN